MLTLEQPSLEAAEAGKLGVRFTCHEGWELARFFWWAFLPLSVIFAIIGVFVAWTQGRLLSAWAIFLVLLFAAMPMLTIMLHITLRLLLARLPFQATKPAKRRLCVDGKGVIAGQEHRVRIRWKRVMRWFFTPAPDHPGLVVLTLESLNGRYRRYWSMLLDEREQKPALLSELEGLRQREVTEVRVIEFDQPLPQRNFPSGGLWAGVLGFCIFFLGMFLLIPGLASFDHEKPTHRPRPVPAGQSDFERTLSYAVRRLHISNERQLRMLFWAPGSVLMVAGSIILLLDSRRQRRLMAEGYRLFDLELERMEGDHARAVNTGAP